MSADENDRHLTRRQTIGAAGVLGAGALLGGGLRFEGSDSVSIAEAAAACTLTAEQEEGPFYVDLEKVRSNIVGSRTGVPLVLRIKIINSSTCKVIKGAAVDIWHADAVGKYSDESSNATAGQTWLRGVQLTDANGLAEFRTVYPGYYQGRAPHIHAKVHIGGSRSGSKYSGGRVSHTGQLFLPESMSAQVYKLAPYTSDPNSLTRLSSDHVYTQQHGSSVIAKVKKRGASLRSGGVLATITFAVNPSASH
jgi:protocatechuate 3,4-dioxygenase beta subunit